MDVVHLYFFTSGFDRVDMDAEPYNYLSVLSVPVTSMVTVLGISTPMVGMRTHITPFEERERVDHPGSLTENSSRKRVESCAHGCGRSDISDT